jgi:large subunit ribosomal protein L25
MILTIFALSVQVHRDETMVNILNLLIVQADEGTTLKVNLLIEFKGEVNLLSL